MTTNHGEIRRWATERGGKPACVRGTGSKADVGLLRIDFPGGAEESLEEISWDEFFEKFDEENLAFLYQDETKDRREGWFFKFVERDEAGGHGREQGRSRRRASTSGGKSQARLRRKPGKNA